MGGGTRARGLADGVGVGWSGTGIVITSEFIVRHDLEPHCCRNRPSSPLASSGSSALFSAIGFVAVAVFIVWLLLIIWPYLVAALVLLGVGVAARGMRRQG